MRSSKDNTPWAGDRIERMIRTRNLESEASGLKLLDGRFETPTKVGDFGSGIGRRRVYFPDAEYIGFDREDVMLENAKKYFPDYDIRRGDITQVDVQYPELVGYFDLILTFSVVQYNNEEEQLAIYKCIHRCLKPGGLYYWRENSEGTVRPHEVLPDLFEQLAVDDIGHERLFKKL